MQQAGSLTPRGGASAWVEQAFRSRLARERGVGQGDGVGGVDGAIASMVFVASDDEADETAMQEDLAAVTQRYGPWAARVLWDHVSAAARTVSALCPGSVGCIDIPGDMPDVTYPSPVGQTGRTTNDE